MSSRLRADKEAPAAGTITIVEASTTRIKADLSRGKACMTASLSPIVVARAVVDLLAPSATALHQAADLQKDQLLNRRVTLLPMLQLDQRIPASLPATSAVDEDGTIRMAANE